MSADNFVGVRPQKVDGQLTGKYEIFEYGNMSVFGEDCMYYKDEKPSHIVATANADTRYMALGKAHDIVNEMDICEYGVVEMPPIPDEPCGRCFVCIHERKIVADDVQRCDKCNEPIAQGDWCVGTAEGVFHTHCEPRDNYDNVMKHN